VPDGVKAVAGPDFYNSDVELSNDSPVIFSLFLSMNP
jgi:hypothetical protein